MNAPSTISLLTNSNDGKPSSRSIHAASNAIKLSAPTTVPYVRPESKCLITEDGKKISEPGKNAVARSKPLRTSLKTIFLAARLTITLSTVRTAPNIWMYPMTQNFVFPETHPFTNKPLIFAEKLNVTSIASVIVNANKLPSIK
jgi:hypothetical protein